MHATGNEFQQLIELAPEWQSIVSKVKEQGTVSSVISSELGRTTACVYAVLEQVGAQSIYIKLGKPGQLQSNFVKLMRDNYLLVLTTKMYRANTALAALF